MRVPCTFWTTNARLKTELGCWNPCKHHHCLNFALPTTVKLVTAVRLLYCPGHWHWTANLNGIAGLSISLVCVAAFCPVSLVKTTAPYPPSRSPLECRAELAHRPASTPTRSFLLPSSESPCLCPKASSQSFHKNDECFQAMQATQSSQRDLTSWETESVGRTQARLLAYSKFSAKWVVPSGAKSTTLSLPYRKSPWRGNVGDGQPRAWNNPEPRYWKVGIDPILTRDHLAMGHKHNAAQASWKKNILKWENLF